MKTTKTREFTETDWMGFAGATRWDNGDRPLMRNFKSGLCVIADVCGVSFYFYEEKDNGDVDGYWWDWGLTFKTQAQAKMVLDGLPANLTQATLNVMGLERNEC